MLVDFTSAYGLAKETTILFCDVFQVSVMRKLSSIFSIIVANLFIGTEKLRTSLGTYGRAKGSNIPMTALGFGESFSRYGYVTMEEQPDPIGADTPSGRDSLKFKRVKRPDRTSGGAKKMTTSGLSSSSSLSHLLNVTKDLGALKVGQLFIIALTSSGDFL